MVALDLPEAGVLRLGDLVDVLPAGCPGAASRWPSAPSWWTWRTRPDGRDKPVLVAVLPGQARTLASVRDACPMAAVLVE